MTFDLQDDLELERIYECLRALVAHHTPDQQALKQTFNHYAAVHQMQQQGIEAEVAHDSPDQQALQQTLDQTTDW